MSDDLVMRLYSLHKQATVERSHFYVGRCAADAIDRIEELEAKLRKSALQELSALGQASEAYQAQLAAEAKLAQQDDLVQAAVAAALRKAGEAVEDYCSDAPDLAGHGHSVGIRDYILALITPDAQAALNRVVAAEREHGFWAGRSCGGSKAEIDAALSAIREGVEND